MTDDDPRRADEAADGEVMRVLMDAYPAPMTVEEIQRDLHESKEWRVSDSLDRLLSAGLVHGFDRFILPTRTAFHAARLEFTLPS